MTPPFAITAAYVAVQDGLGQQMADDALIRALATRPDLEVTRFPVGSVRSTLEVRRRLPLRLVESAPDLLKRAIGAVTYPRNLVHRFDCRLPPAPREVVTVYDLAPLRFPDEGEFPEGITAGLRRALAVVCPSRYSADEVQRQFGLTNVHVVLPGVDPACRGAVPLTAAERQSLGVPERYLLHTGGATQRKNLASLASAWRAVHANYSELALVLCGPPDPRRSALFDELPSTIALGKVPRTTLLGLMAGAAAVVVPSLYEGYGLPAAEAMACGVPVVVSSRASLPEVVGPHGLVVEPDADGLAGGIERALGGVDHVALESARAFALERTWAVSAQQHVDIYRGLH